ncbi:hypothetical protein [Gordonia sp. (in: high G+C Gram-positive bacteria)]|uniref:hypothetical protein n=1 Tax=Gordonia sp. (in: high G+C Gram-positive bacteria) TaxID=84139 RepID=UPI003C75A0B0
MHATTQQPATLDELAAAIDTAEAARAVAHMLRIFGRDADWNADTIHELANAVTEAKPPNLPSIVDQDPHALTYWTNLT